MPEMILPGVILSVLTTVVPVFSLVGIGFAAARAGALDEAAQRGLVLFAFNLAAPALLFSAGIDARSIGGGAAVAFFAGCLAAYAAVFLLARRRLGLGLAGSSLAALNASFGNVVGMGIPLALAAFGADGLETLLGIIALHSLTLIGLTTVLLEVAQRGGGGLRALGRVAAAVLTNPIVAALLGAILWRALGLPKLPGPVKATLNLLGSASPPVALVSLGAGLAAFRLGVGWREAALTVLAKTLLMPGLVWAACLALGLGARETAVTVTAAALPTGSSTVLLAVRYGDGADRAGAAVIASTLLSILTLSALIGVFR